MDIIDQMKRKSPSQSIYYRAWLACLAPEEKFLRKESAAEMTEKFPDLNYDPTLKKYFGQLRMMGVVQSSKEGRTWYDQLTPKGAKVWEWMMNTDEGLHWGKMNPTQPENEDSHEEPVGVGKEDSPTLYEPPHMNWSLGEYGVLLDGRLSYNFWRLVAKTAGQHGYRSALIAPGVEVVAVTRDEEGKKKAVKIPTWSELNPRPDETLAEKKARLLAELRELEANG